MERKALNEPTALTKGQTVGRKGFAPKNYLLELSLYRWPKTVLQLCFSKMSASLTFLAYKFWLGVCVTFSMMMIQERGGDKGWGGGEERKGEMRVWHWSFKNSLR